MILRVTACFASPVALRGPVHLDGLLLAAHPDAREVHATKAHRLADLTRIAIPVVAVNFEGRECYAASAARWHDARPGREHFVARKDAVDVDRRATKWNPKSGPERLYHLPLPTVEARAATWLCVGRRKGVKQLLRYVRHVGAKRAHGYGEVVAWSVEEVDEQPMLAFVDPEGCAARHLPPEWCERAAHQDVGATGPPYWHPDNMAARVPTGTSCRLRPAVSAMIAELW